MKKTHRILALTTAAMVAAQAGFAQTATAPTAPVAPNPAPINMDFLDTLFAGGATPDEQGVRDAFATAGLTVERYRTGWDGEIRVRATTADGQTVRVRVEDGEVRYSLRSGGNSTDGNNGDSSTSDANGDTSDSNGADTSDNTRDGNGDNSRGGNGGNS